MSTASSVWALTSLKRWVLVWAMIFLFASLLLAAWEALHVRWNAVEWTRIQPLPLLRMRTAWLSTLMLLVVAVAFVSSQSAPALVYKDI